MDLYDCDPHAIDYLSLDGLKIHARLIDIYDGDTITCIIPCFGGLYKFKIRINGIDTCEIKNKNLAEKNKALLAKNLVFTTLTGASDITPEYLFNNVTIIWLECLSFDKYGRLLANVYTRDKITCVADTLLSAGLANSYDGGTKTKFTMGYL